MNFAYVFSGKDRISGFYGHLDVTPSGELVLQDFLASCTHRQPIASELEALMIERCLRECGWINFCESGAPVWQSGVYRMALISSLAADDAYLLHLALFLGNGRKYFRAHISNHVPRHYSLLSCQGARRERYISNAALPKETIKLLHGKRLTAFTGAGVSIASGIPPFFGKGSLDERLRLLEEFPGEIVAWMCAKPDALALEIGAFQAKLLTASPNRAHFLLAKLEANGTVRQIITANLDMLHELAGSRSVVAPLHFSGTCDCADGKQECALLALGVSDDDDKVVARAREAGWIVVVANPQPPSYLAEGDLYVRMDAESFLEALVQDAEPTQCGTISNAQRGHSNSILDTIPDLGFLLSEVSRGTTSGHSAVHGWRHWMETAWFGLQLLSEVSDADPAVVLLFALLHDSRRHNDHDDPNHGRRAATLIPQLSTKLLRLSDRQATCLVDACEGHADGYTTTNATIGVCWDADRLGLWRIGVKPMISMLSVNASRNEERIRAARRVGAQRLSWEALFEAYAAL
jgi:uncharacterized protein